ncbi:MAG: YihA family ribosome biogenesis GTP-binding protein [Calditrichaeota bacterium]|nr:YihA family ribosome biogenesis GTP-binding protein [Calditrichota bacterium]MCB9367877.1 YihA family ribosome biogenesis GTP-binding protein [Calditrichota bacterium]
MPQAEFVKSCTDLAQAPKPALPEIAFVGRSNVGKSSLINSLLNRKGLALASATPGKTRLLNYFKIGGSLCYFVDLPGYGYAKVSKSLQEEWSGFLEDYLAESPRLNLVVLIADSRRGLTDLDMQMIQALQFYRRNFIVVATKIDKLNRQERDKALTSIRGPALSLGASAVVPYSSAKHEGREEMWNVIYEHVK